MASLMEFDKALRRLGPSSAYATTAYAATAAAEGEESVRNAFQVVDEPTRAAAFLPRGAGPGAGLIILDLPQRTIRASGNLPIPASGEILAHDGKALTDRAITYILPQEWSIQTL